MGAKLLINGVAPGDSSQALAVNDRGLSYGDGLFETAFVKDGEVRFLDAHLARLFADCARLGIAPPDRQRLLDEIRAVTASESRAVLKIVITRGVGGRGYRPGIQAQSTRIVALHPALAQDAETIIVRWCTTRLGRNARLAGIKHLNRLEQVLARMEWNDTSIGEGLMLDTEGELVCATSANLFIVREGVLTTPDLRFCGVAGVMRNKVLEAAAVLGIASSQEPLWPHDLDLASEVFLTNALRGIRSVQALESLRWDDDSVARRLRAALQL
jgi:4-amino-4-deoxychorismate lyase